MCRAGERGPWGLLLGGAGGCPEECARFSRGRGREFHEVGGEEVREDEEEGGKNEGWWYAAEWEGVEFISYSSQTKTNECGQAGGREESERTGRQQKLPEISIIIQCIY